MYRLSAVVLAILSTSFVLRAHDTRDGIAAGAPKNTARSAAVARHDDPGVTYFGDLVAITVKGVDQDIRYLNRAKHFGLTAGMTLIIKRSSHYFTPPGGESRGSLIVATMGVSSVSSTSAMCQIRARNRVHRGDTAWLSFVQPKPAKKPPLSSWRELVSTTNNLQTDTQTSCHPILPLAAESADVGSARVFAQAESFHSRRGEDELFAAALEQMVLSNQSGGA